MKFYLAGKYSSHPQMREKKKELESLGHKVMSRWIMGEHEIMEDRLDRTDEMNQRFAKEDLEDIENSNAVIWFSEPTNEGRGGRHVEFGYAITRRIQVFVIGRKENVFHYYDKNLILHFDNWEHFLVFLLKEKEIVENLFKGIK